MAERAKLGEELRLEDEERRVAAAAAAAAAEEKASAEEEALEAARRRRDEEDAEEDRLEVRRRGGGSQGSCASRDQRWFGGKPLVCSHDTRVRLLTGRLLVPCRLRSWLGWPLRRRRGG